MQIKWNAIRVCVGLLFILQLFCVAVATCRADDKNIQGEEVQVGNSFYLMARIQNCIDATITVTGTLDNMSSTVKFPFTVETTGQSRILLAVVTPVDSTKEWGYTWNADWKYGHRLSAAPAESYIYSLPYRGGQRLVVQGANGTFSHYAGSQNEQALDFAMPIGTPVYPARPGVVVAIRTDCTVGGPDVRLKKDGNYLVIRHSDGTYAEYLHLETDGVLVHLGDQVTTNQPVALSGNTGFTSTPHLHFEVFYTIDGITRKSLPVVFHGSAGTILVQQGSYY